MAKEQVQSPVSTKTSQENSPTIDQHESQPVVYQPGKCFALPRAGLPGRVQALQRAAGNRSVQRLLPRNVIQREGGKTTPIPPLPDLEARRTLALDLLKKTYGGMIKQESRVVEAAGMAALQAQYDQPMMRQQPPGVFVEDGKERPWAVGDAAKHPSINKDFAGFNDPTSGSIFIDTTKKPDEQTATMAHEMLHANASGEVLGVLGRGVDEGLTETLTQKAFAKAGYSAPGDFYSGEIVFVGALSSMFGGNTMLYSYFTGVGPLRSMMDTTLDDDGAFDTFAVQVRAKNWAWTDTFFRRYQQIREGVELEKKVNAVVSRLEGLWVSDDDVAHVINIFHGSSPDEQARLKQEIQARIESLSSHGQRARLRILIGF